MLLPSRYKALYGGRGALKSHFFSELGIKRAISQPGFRMVCVREVQKSLKESAKRLIEDKIDRFSLQSKFRITNDSIGTPGGGIISFQGLQDHTAESIKSLEGYDVAWVEEAQTSSKRSMEYLRPTIRKEGSEIWCSWNPRNPSDPVDSLFRGLQVPDDSIVIKTTYEDNPWFPGVLEQERLFDLKNNPGRYAHIWLGEYEPMAIGAIWNRQNLHANRRNQLPAMHKIVVSVDHAVSSEEYSNEHGIIVAGVGEDKRGYVLDDLSLHGTPEQWGTRTVAAFDKWDADEIVIEINQGGDLVRHTLQSIRPNLPIHEVRATRGKHVRAEPISSLYQLDKISHVGTFNDLEDQMCKMTAGGFEGEGSPDRVDALVWAFTRLFPSLTKKEVKKVERIVIPNKHRLGHRRN